jgi:hypothetical protein
MLASKFKAVSITKKDPILIDYVFNHRAALTPKVEARKTPGLFFLFLSF